MLRPSNSLLGSSRAARTATVRMERRKAIGRAAGFGMGLLSEVFGTALDLALLLGLPLLYVASSYLVLDLPVRWLSGHQRPTLVTGAAFAAAVVVALVGISRALRGADPIAPVRPRFARIMLVLSWAAALLFTVSDLAS